MTTHLLKLASLAVLLAFGAGCSVVKHTRTRPDWVTVDQDRVKRLVVVTHPFPAGQQSVAEMWSKMAAKRVDLKREFIILDRLVRPAAEALDPKSLCVDAAEGVLWLQPEVIHQGGGVDAKVVGRLFRCVDAEEVWTTEAGGSWPTTDDKLTGTVAEYTADFGPEVEPFVVASYHLLNETLDTLPNPVLTEADEDDKIENTQ